MQNTSCDFEKITFIGIDGVGTDSRILKSLKFVKKQIPNSNYKFLTSGNYDTIEGIDVVNISSLDYNNFSRFCLTQMKNYIDTEYMIYCHGDGFVINADKWDSNFLKYDYIGAPWPRHNLENSSARWDQVGREYRKSKGMYNIGNGGFSLRSKKLLNLLSELYKEEYYGIPEDLVIAVVLREKLEEKGILFPDISTAGSFSCEATMVDGHVFSSNTSFGFHCGGTHPDKVKLLETV